MQLMINEQQVDKYCQERVYTQQKVFSTDCQPDWDKTKELSESNCWLS